MLSTTAWPLTRSTLCAKVQRAEFVLCPTLLLNADSIRGPLLDINGQMYEGDRLKDATSFLTNKVLKSEAYDQ